MQDIIITIAGAIIALAGALVTRYVIPWIRTKTTAQERETIAAAVKTLVAAAEQIFDKAVSGGVNKKTWVLAQLEALGLPLAESDVNAIIEAAVLELNRAGRSTVNAG